MGVAVYVLLFFYDIFNMYYYHYYNYNHFTASVQDYPVELVPER